MEIGCPLERSLNSTIEVTFDKVTPWPHKNIINPTDRSLGRPGSAQRGNGERLVLFYCVVGIVQRFEGSDWLSLLYCRGVFCLLSEGNMPRSNNAAE